MPCKAERAEEEFIAERAEEEFHEGPSERARSSTLNKPAEAEEEFKAERAKEGVQRKAE